MVDPIFIMKNRDVKEVYWESLGCQNVSSEMRVRVVRYSSTHSIAKVQVQANLALVCGQNNN